MLDSVPFFAGRFSLWCTRGASFFSRSLYVCSLTERRCVATAATAVAPAACTSYKRNKETKKLFALANNVSGDCNNMYFLIFLVTLCVIDAKSSSLCRTCSDTLAILFNTIYRLVALASGKRVSD